MPGTESQQAQDLLEQKFPAASGASARVVFAAPAGEKLTDPDNRAAVRASIAQATRAAEVSAVTDPFETKALSPGGRIGFADVIYPVPADEIEEASRDELGAVALPALHMKLGLPDGGSRPTSTTERRSYDLLTAGFGRGFNGQLTAVVDAPGLERDQQKQLAQPVADEPKGMPGVAAVSEPIQNERGDVTIVQVTPTSSPASDETKDLVELMRDKAAAIPERSGVATYVTGQTAINIDTADQLSAALPKYIVVVVGLALLLLTVVSRSILVPIKAAAGFLISIGASMGLVVWIFQDGNLAELFSVSQEGPIVSFLPILLIGILFGLAMDSGGFRPLHPRFAAGHPRVTLVSRMRERFVRTGDAQEAIVTGYGQSGRVVTAAAIIMTAVFGAFVLSDDPVIKSIGVSLAFGVLADAFVVRMTLVPAVMALLGRHAWRLPKRVGRWLPDPDTEGEQLMKTLTPGTARH